MAIFGKSPKHSNYNLTVLILGIYLACILIVGKLLNSYLIIIILGAIAMVVFLPIMIALRANFFIYFYNKYIKKDKKKNQD